MNVNRDTTSTEVNSNTVEATVNNTTNSRRHELKKKYRTLLFNYNIIKRLAKKMKLSVKDLLIQTQQNDPYYVGSPTELRSSEWMADIVKKYLSQREKRKVHDRAIHYAILSQGLDRPLNKNNWKSYIGDDSDFPFTMKAVQNARLLGLIPWEAIEDKKSPELLIFARYWDHKDESFKITPEILASQFIERLQIFNPQLQQAYHVEFWVEKTTINDILLPIARKYGVNIQPFSGQSTLTKVYELKERIKLINKPTRILYISDYDKSGEEMPVSTGRKLQWFVDELRSEKELDVKLDKILLTREQVKSYDLPTTLGKEPKVELDALEVFYPSETAKIVEAAVARYIDLDVAATVYTLNQELRAKIKEQLLAALDSVAESINQITIPENISEHLPIAEQVLEDDSVLYDSSRDYFDQTTRFKLYQSQRDDS